MDKRFEVVIVGAGPAGMSAAVYASRAGKKTLLLERGAPGGKMVNTYEIENYPGREKVSGADLAADMFGQSGAFGAQYAYGDVKKIVDGTPKKVVLQDGSEILADSVIIATGTKERKMGVPGEEEYAGKGVSYCAVCDGAFFRGKPVAVIGGGNSAVGAAIYLSRFASRVYIVIRRDVFRADAVNVERMKQISSIQPVVRSVPAKVLGKDGKVCGLAVKSVDTGEEAVLDVSAVFPYIGADPATDFLEGSGVRTERGYILTDEKMETSVKGIYAAGDVRKKALRQIVTAASDGAVAAEQCGRA